MGTDVLTDEEKHPQIKRRQNVQESNAAGWLFYECECGGFTKNPSVLRTFPSFLDSVPLSLIPTEFNHLWCFCPERYFQAFISVGSLWIISLCTIKGNPIWVFKSLLINHKSHSPPTPLIIAFLSPRLLPLPCSFLALTLLSGIYKNLEPKLPRLGFHEGLWKPLPQAPSNPLPVTW